MKKSPQSATIIGAGIAGCFMAIMLAKRGCKVDIYEQTSLDEIITNSSKRSFNLTFYNYAVDSLKQAGLWKAVEPSLITLQGSVTKVTPTSAPVRVGFDLNEMRYYTIQRADLLAIIINEAQKQKNITFHFQTSVRSIDRYKKTMLVYKKGAQKPEIVQTSVILGTDGVNSTVRQFIQQGQETNHKQEYTDWEYKQIPITKELAKTLNMQPNYQHSWTRQFAVLIAFPDGKDSFNALLALPKDKTRGYAKLTTKAAIKTFITENFPDILPALPIITQTILNNPPGYFVTIYTSPWYYKDFMALLGDAAHGFLPFFGLGMSAAFGDCMVIIDLLDKYGPDWGKIFPLYQEARKKHTDVIANLSKGSLLRFRRYKKADYDAIYDRLETVLFHRFPKYVLPPLFHLVAGNPNKSADYYIQYSLQRRRASIIGITLMVKLMTKAVDVLEMAKLV